LRQRKLKNTSPHNEALRQLDALVQLSVISTTNTSIHEPHNGDRYIIGPNPEGVLGGHENEIAAFQDAAWAFFKPQVGWLAYVAEFSGLYIFDGIEWSSLESGETPLLGINATADMTNRLTVKSPATLLDHEGAGHQLKLNKAREADTSTILFQTNYVSHAEIGLAGDHNLHLKVSRDGNEFKDSMIMNHDTGDVSFPNGTNIRKMGSSVENSGGTNFHYGIPNISVSYDGRYNLDLVQNRVYFCPFYVDRPTKIFSGFIAQSVESSTANAVMRAGLFELGKASGNHWEIGKLVADLGTCPADIAGHKDFDLSEPLILRAGWYVCAVGTNGADVVVRNVRTHQSGQSFLVKWGSGEGADLRFSGAISHLYSNNASSEIEEGFPDFWPNTVIDLLTVQPMAI